MEFTKEEWEAAPEGAKLKYIDTITEGGLDIHLIGYKTTGCPVIEFLDGRVSTAGVGNLRIVLPKRKVTVQLWRMKSGRLATAINNGSWKPSTDWALLGEHTFEIEEK